MMQDTGDEWKPNGTSCRSKWWTHATVRHYYDPRQVRGLQLPSKGPCQHTLKQTLSPATHATLVCTATPE